MKYDEEKLWVAVITQAIKDAICRNEELKRTALKWFNSRSFEAVCDLANLDSNRLKNILSKFGINKESFMDFSSKRVSEIKLLLIDNIKECLSYLLPKGEFYQDKLYVGNINEDQIIVETTGEKAGNWYMTNETRGDIVKLWTLVIGDINLAKKWLKDIERISKKPAFSIGYYLSDTSPMPKDIIAPRILTPGGLLVIDGTPKVGKSNFLLSLLVHMAAGVPFLGMKPTRPLKIFYLQNEIEYDYIRERLQQLKINKKLLDSATKNLAITPKTKLTLNSEGIEKIKDTMSGIFDIKTVDLIVIDSLYNALDYGNMLSFLRDGIEKLRFNPMAGIIIMHHTKKVSKTLLEKNPFQALSGAGVLRSLYTSGIVMFRPNEHKNVLQVMYELKNGKPIPTKFVSEVNGQWRASIA